MNELVLSLFPGIGILDKGFEEQGFCVVRGPDLLWGGDIKRFHPPAGVFEGVIGGPPCQAHSSLGHLLKHEGRELAEDLIPEFERVVGEANPVWFIMENVVTAPIPEVAGYLVDPSVLNNRWLGGEQSRKHRFNFGTRDGRHLIYVGLCALEDIAWAPRVMASGSIGNTHFNGRRNMHKVSRTRAHLRDCLRLQGLPEDFLDHAPFTVEASMRVIGNAVAMPMARVLARAVRAALERSG
jgi:DNA (cytosine-5)-methyltransferase 1